MLFADVTTNNGHGLRNWGSNCLVEQIFRGLRTIVFSYACLFNIFSRSKYGVKLFGDK
jgi:hypothetical protein